MAAAGDRPDEHDDPRADPAGPDALLAAALAGGRDVADAAAAAGVSESTVYRRLRSPEFRKLVAQLRGEMVGQALGRMAALMTEAADRLKKLLNSRNERVRLAAVKVVLEVTPRLREQSEIEERLVALEAAAGGGTA